MHDERRREAEEIFHDLADLPPREREHALAARCGDDEELRSFVARLLEVDSVGTDDVLRPVAYHSVEEDEADELSSKLPEQIGHYQIIRKIGEGGMGTVFEARQETPKRTVALKILRPGFASRNLLWRFRHEADFLGQLQHPGIAQVHEAGVAEVIMSSDTGSIPALRQPFFAMEFIRGVPLTNYADENNLGTRQRLELIARVCDAVHHAHQKGVIHRDLKPANILVVDEDEVALEADPSSWGTSRAAGPCIGQPKILDFGVARATDADVHTVAVQTGVGQLIGTIPYMSPEQVTGDPNQMDIRSDVYALGVILYETLGGSLPHDVQDLSIPEAARKIRDEEPRALGSHDKSLRGEVETIVTRALEKDKTRRYQSAFDLAADIRRYLRGEAIEAKRNSKIYVLKKTLGRNKLATAGVLALAVTVMASAVALGILYHKQTLASEAARQARIEAEASAEKAQQQAAVSEAAMDFLQRTLSSANPQQEKGPDYTVREALVEAAKRVEEDFPDQPEVEAAIQSTIGTTYSGLGMPEEAEPHLRAALEIRRRLHDGDHLDLAESIYQMGVFQHETGEHEDAKRLSGEALAMQRRLLGEENRSVAKSLRLFGMSMKELTEMAAAESLISEALALDRRIDGGRHEGVLESLNELAYVKMLLGENDACRKLLEESLDLTRELTGENHLPFARQAANLAAVLTSMGDHAGAEPLIRKAVAIRLDKLGEDHPEVGGARIVLARLLHAKGDFAGAADVHRRVLASDRKSLPAGHPYLAGDLINLAETLDRLGEHLEAEATYREALEVQLSHGRDEHPRTLTAMMGLGRCLMAQGKLDEAEPLLQSALDSRRRLIGEENPSTLIGMNDLASLFHQQGKLAEAEHLFRDALNKQRQRLGDDNPQALTTAHNCARLLIDRKMFDEAEQLLRSTIARRRRVLGEAHPYTLISMTLLGRLFMDQKRFDEAEVQLLKTYTSTESALPDGHPTARAVVSDLIDLYEAWERPEEATRWRARMETIVGDHHVGSKPSTR